MSSVSGGAPGGKAQGRHTVPSRKLCHLAPLPLHFRLISIAVTPLQLAQIPGRLSRPAEFLSLTQRSRKPGTQVPGVNRRAASANRGRDPL